ncbi:MAG: DUF4402 domain-containing protein [Marinilabiliales bacterium]|nr:DUF4402 domain-containing protein [Marinilabiliales bacterium]
MIRLLGIFLIGLVGFQVSVQGQTVVATDKISGLNSAITNVSCVIVTPIGITKVRDMFFGSIVSGQGGAITLSPIDNNISSSGSATLSNSSSYFASALFEINAGINNITSKAYSGYTITLPRFDIVLTNEFGRTMRVSNFTSRPSAQEIATLDNNGTGVLTVGATLYVDPNQEIGHYVSVTPFPVTVNFY